MNTKEAIDFLEKKNISGDELFKMKIKNIKKLARMLKRGEALKAEDVELKAYKQMWEETEVLISSQISGDTSYATLVWLRREMTKLKQKYFPKEIIE